MDMEKIRAICEEELGSKSSHPWKEKGNKYHHGLRTASIAVELRKMVFPGDASNDEKLTVAGWFHDVANGNEHHQELGAQMTREMLSGLVREDALEEICSWISVHDERGHEDAAPMLKLLQDADLLDHLGAYDIWMCSIEFAREGSTLPEAAERFNERYEKYARYRTRFNYEETKRVFDRRTAIVRAFTEQFTRESGGALY